ncbi:porin family protein [Mucilaginibacter agri]|nr:porin family protein [Mucilaginibacter agri]
MKKHFFVAITLLLMAGSVSAQYYRRPQPRRHERTYDNNFRPAFSIIGGINVANVIKSSGNYQFDTDTKIGANVGIGLDLPILYPLSFAPEVLYSQKGYTAQTGYGQFKQRADFIDVPLLAKFHVVPGFNIVVGPQISFLVSTTNTYNNGFSQSSQQYFNNTTDGYNKTLIGGVAGVSFDLSRNVELRARYSLDLNRINDDGDIYVPNYRNQAWQFGLGFRF